MVELKDDDIREILRVPAEYQPPVSARSLRSVAARRVRTNRVLVGVAAVVALSTVTAAGSYFVTRTGDSSPVSSAPTTPVLTHQDPEPEFAALISETQVLERRGDCLYFSDIPVIWPPSAVWSKEEQTVRISRPEGDFLFQVGKTFPAGVGGGRLPLALADASLTSEMLERTRACMPNTGDGDVLFVN